MKIGIRIADSLDKHINYYASSSLTPCGYNRGVKLLLYFCKSEFVCSAFTLKLLIRLSTNFVTSLAQEYIKGHGLLSSPVFFTVRIHRCYYLPINHCFYVECIIHRKHVSFCTVSYSTVSRYGRVSGWHNFSTVC